MGLLSTALRVLAFLGLAASLVLLAGGQLLIGALGDISTVSLGSVCFLYLLMETRLERDSVPTGSSIVLALLYADVFLQTYEVLYHFTYPVYLNYFRPPFLNPADLRYIAFEALLLSPILLVRRQVRLSWLSAALAALFVSIWAVWMLYGFPQYFTNDTYYYEVLTAASRHNTALVLNFGSKTVLALLFASLVRRDGRAGSGPTRPPT
jgi:hypothetical protein